jgi:hypothetical protein
VDDFDGDRYADVAGFSRHDVRLLFNQKGTSFTPGPVVNVESANTRAAVGNLDGDTAHTADIVVPSTHGLYVLRGQKDRLLAPLAFASFTVPLMDLRVQPVALNATKAGDLPFVLGGLPASGQLALLMPSYAAATNGGVVPGTCTSGVRCIASRGHSVFDLAGRIQPAHFHNAPKPSIIGRAEELVLGFLCDTQINVATPYTCTSTGTSDPSQCRLVPSFTATITLPGKIAVPDPGGAAGMACSAATPANTELAQNNAITVTDLDGDGNLDLLIAVRLARGGRVIAVTYGDGDGHFYDDAGRISHASVHHFPATPPHGLPAGATGEMYFAFDAGDLDNDGRVDFVGAGLLTVGPALPEEVGGVFISGPTDKAAAETPLTAVFTTPPTERWQTAVIADFNRDGDNDVATVSVGDQGIGFLLGDGDGTFSAGRVPTLFDIGEMRTGDFNGDHYTDLAFVEEGCPPSADTSSSLSVLFGAPTGLEPSVTSMGCFNYIQEIEPGWLNYATGTIDRSADIIAISNATIDGTGMTTLAILLGTTGNRLVAPYLLTDPVTEVGGIPAGVNLGHFAVPIPGATAPSNALDMIALTYGSHTTMGPNDIPAAWWLIRGEGGGDFFPIDYKGTMGMFGYGSAKVNLQDAKQIGTGMDCHGLTIDNTFLWRAVDLGDGNSGSVVSIDNLASPPQIIVFRQLKTGSTMKGSELKLGCTVSPIDPNLGRQVFAFNITDIDGDGRPDLILNFGTSVMAFLQDPKTGDFNMASPIEVPLPPAPSIGPAASWAPLALTSILNSASGVSLVMATTNGVYAAAFDPNQRKFVLVDAPVAALETESAPIAAVANLPVKDFTWHALTRDMNGDGVQDLIILENRRVHVYNGCYALPGGVTTSCDTSGRLGAP